MRVRLSPENVTAVTLSAQLDNKTVVSIIAKDDVEAEKEQILLLWKRERLYLHLRLTLQ